MQAVILAGGLGTRLGEVGKNKPKSLITVCGKPFLEIQLEKLKSQGYSDILLCVGYLWEQIYAHFGDGKRYGVKLRYSIERKPLGTAGALKNAEQHLEDNFFTIYGDSFLTLNIPNIERYFLKMKKLGLMTVIKNFGKWEKSNTAIAGNNVTLYSKVEKSSGMVYCDYGLNIFNKKILGLIPPKQYTGLELVFSRLIEQKELLAYEISERFYEIGSVTGLAELEKHLSEEAS